MKKVNNKKGFTLAELLVVVAILAILIAIAVPIFGGAMDNARQTAINANVRSIKSAGMVEIMNTPALLSAGGPWYATCTISANGDMGTVNVTTSGTESIPTQVADTYTVEIEATELTATP